MNRETRRASIHGMAKDVCSATIHTPMLKEDRKT
jgi:hypothetical protein